MAPLSRAREFLAPAQGGVPVCPGTDNDRLMFTQGHQGTRLTPCHDTMDTDCLGIGVPGYHGYRLAGDWGSSYQPRETDRYQTTASNLHRR